MTTYSVFCVGIFRESSNSWVPENRFYKGELQSNEVKGNFLGYADNVEFPLPPNFRLRNGNRLPFSPIVKEKIVPKKVVAKITPSKLAIKNLTQKIFIHAREGEKCFYCKDYLPLNISTKDHVKAKSLGGKNHVKNLVLCCKECNYSKRDLTVIEFMQECNTKLNDCFRNYESKFEDIPRLKQIIESCNELIKRNRHL